MNSPPSLENLGLVRLSIILWTREGMKNDLAVSSNGVLYMDEELMLVENLIIQLPLSESLKKELLNVAERIGYQLDCFITRSPIETQKGLDLRRDLKWTVDGLIDERKTLSNFAVHNLDITTLFVSSCSYCSEKRVVQFWELLSEDDRKEIKKNMAQDVTVSFWIHYLEDKLDDFAEKYEHKILGFDRSCSLISNMFIYSIIKSQRSGLMCFHDKMSLTDVEKLLGQKTSIKPDLYSFLKFIVLQRQRPEYARFAITYFESPLIDHETCYQITKGITSEFYKDLMDFVIRQVNIFGDLHCKIFHRLFFTAPLQVKSLVMDQIDFYLLSLLAKGKMDAVYTIVGDKLKKLVFNKISSRLTNLKGLSLFSAIYMNHNEHLLAQFFDFISQDENDRIIFSSSLTGICSGAIYENS